MFINPHTAIEEGWVTGIADPELQVQPNAIDFTVDELYVLGSTECVISEHGKIMRSTETVNPVTDRRVLHEKGIELNFWTLHPDQIYDGMSNMYVNLPEGVAVMIFTRSTFTRNGMFLTTGLYDTGFKGHVGFVIHNRSDGAAKVAQGTRIGQIAFVASDSAKMYAGGWNHEEGTHYTEGK